MASEPVPLVWHHPQVEMCGPPLEHDFASVAGIVNLADGRVMIAYGAPVNPHNRPPGTVRIYARISSDDCATWSDEREMLHLAQCQACDPVFLRDRSGVLHVFHLGFYASVWPEGADSPDMTRTRSDLWHAASADEGETWTDHKIVFRGYTGATNGAIETREGLLLVPFSYDVTNPGRLVSAVAISCDGGESWQLGQCIDIGGHGDHAGALEPAVIELRDGRIRMLIRTTLGHFLQAFSEDGGFSWSEPQPSVFRSPSSPCHITRLASGNMAIIWNNTMDTTQSRTALHMAVSEDDGQSWTEPVECVRALEEEYPQVSYPFIYEQRPGEMLVRFNHVLGGWSNVKGKMFRISEAVLLGA